jgi:hypothetical protein
LEAQPNNSRRGRCRPRSPASVVPGCRFLPAEYLPLGRQPQLMPRSAAPEEEATCAPQIQQEQARPQAAARSVLQLARLPFQGSSERQQLVLSVSEQEREQVARSGTLIHSAQRCVRPSVAVVPRVSGHSSKRLHEVQRLAA